MQKIFGIFILLLITSFNIQALETPQMSNENPVIILETNQGEIEIVLKPSIAPKACENFLKLISNKYYDGLIFHRVIKDFMIQGGDPTGTGRGGDSVWNRPFEDEFDASATFDRPGILAMANSGPNSNGSQFFITTAETPWLNNHHTIFGEVILGQAVLDKIEGCDTGRNDVPVEKQYIIKAYQKNNVMAHQQ